MHSAASLMEGAQGLLRRLPYGLRRRHLLIPCILLVQLLLLALVSLNRARAPARAAPAAPISLFNVHTPAATPEPPRAKPKPVKVTAPPKIQLKVETALPAPPVFNAAAAESAGFGSSCDVAETLARAFSESEVVKAELARIGPQSRSISNAIMFWDGGWVNLPGNAPADAVETLRRAIVEGVQAAPPECRVEDISGPRFIFVSGEGPTMMLVLGSGAWRWDQLLAEPALESGVSAKQGRTN
jgi:hypothetical protein